MSRVGLLVGVLLSVTSNAASWSVSAADVEALVPVPEQLVLVAAAGEPAAAAREVASAVLAAVRRSGRAKLVMDDAALGPLPAATDEEVRRRAATVPHDVLLIVRVFPQGSGQRLVALVVGTGPGAAPLRSVTVLPQELVAVTAPPPPPPPERDPKVVAYEERRLHFGQKSLIPGKRMAAFVYDEPAYEGTRRLTVDQLFERLGRKDFIEATENRARLRLALGLSAVGVALVGGGLIVADVTSPCARVLRTPDGQCLRRSGEGLRWAGVGTIGAGAVLGLVALLLPRYPPSREAIGEAVEQHNESLRSSLGVSAQVTPEGGRVVLGGRF